MERSGTAESAVTIQPLSHCYPRIYCSWRNTTAGAVRMSPGCRKDAWLSRSLASKPHVTVRKSFTRRIRLEGDDEEIMELPEIVTSCSRSSLYWLRLAVTWTLLDQRVPIELHRVKSPALSGRIGRWRTDGPFTWSSAGILCAMAKADAHCIWYLESSQLHARRAPEHVSRHVIALCLP